MQPAIYFGAQRTQEDMVLARFDYGRLDDARSPARIRLNSTRVRGHRAVMEQVAVGRNPTPWDDCRWTRFDACDLA